MEPGAIISPPTPETLPEAHATLPGSNATDHENNWLDWFDYHNLVDNLGSSTAILVCAGVALLTGFLAFVAMPCTARRMFPKLQDVPPIRQRFWLVLRTFTLRLHAGLGFNSKEWLWIQLSLTLLLVANALIGLIPTAVYAAKASSKASGFALSTAAALPDNSKLAIFAIVVAIVQCIADVVINLKHVQVAANGVSLIFADTGRPADEDSPPIKPGSNVCHQALYAAIHLVVRANGDPRPYGVFLRLFNRIYLIKPALIAAQGLYWVTRGWAGRKMLTTQEMAAAMQVALEDVQQELGLPINGQKPIEDATTPNQYREALEKSHAFNEHLKTCSNNCFQKRAVKDATKEVEAGKAKLAQERTTVYLAQRRPSCMLYCKTLELKEAAFDYLTANHSWLSCERAPLPCDFDCYGLLPTWWFMFLMLLFGVLLLSLVLLLSFNRLVFGGALILRYFICDQPLPDLSLGADHAAEEWTGTGAFCGTTGILNTLLVDLEGSFGPVLICLLFADCFVLYLCFLVIKAALGEISETRLMVHVAYCACVFEILAVTLGILSGGHLGKMIEAWTGNGFAGMMSLFGERSEASARYFTYYILLRVFILIPALKLNRSALHASDLLRLLSWFIGGICMIIACPVATVLSWLFPTRCPGGARHAFDRVWTAMDSTVAFIANWAAYVLLWVLALVVALICVGCVVPLVAWLVWAIKRAAENCTEDGFCFELAYTVYCDFQKTCWTLRRWASVPGSKVAPLIAIGGHDDNAHGGSAHFHAHEYIGIVAMLVYYPGVAYSATAVVVTATSAGFQLQLAAVICFLVSYQQAEGNPSLGLWTVCSVQCRVWAGLLRLLVTAAMVMHKGLAPLECLPLLVAAVLYIIACLMLIYPALRKLEELPDREAAAWANRLGIVPKQEVARQCYVFPCMRALRRFTASMGSAASRIMQTTTDDEGSSAAAMEEGLAGPGRSPLANLTNSPAQRRGGHKALTFELY